MKKPRIRYMISLEQEYCVGVHSLSATTLKRGNVLTQCLICLSKGGDKSSDCSDLRTYISLPVFKLSYLNVMKSECH